ncbi:sensor histidine kinase [Pseudonocardia lacus]|uniref:sensor histidine kinase n=1 Tax=Pseudonocardia lacus TaxID=2835865 RepID=UPI001BDBFFF5|nr:ATP-binding protein [Pseudonocardia lacus]
MAPTPDRGPRTPRIPFGYRWAIGALGAGALTVLVELPAVRDEPFFVGVNAAVVISLVALGHYLVAQHEERFTGLCFVAAAAGWIVLSLDVHTTWGSLPSWLFGSAIVYTSLGCGVLRWGRSRLDADGRRWVAVCLAGTVGATVPIALVSRPEWLGFSPTAFWPAPWADLAASTALAALASLGFVVVGAWFARVALRRLRSATPAQRRILRPLSLAAAGWGGAAAVVNGVGALWPGLVPLHANSTIVGLLSIGVTAALATAINRGRILASTFVEALPTERTPESLTAYARSALSDPTAELLFVVPGRKIVIDGKGRLRELPDADRGDRFVQWITGTGGEPVAALVGGAVLRDDPAAVRSFAAVLSIVAENQQLHAVLRMRLAQLNAARAAERLALDRARAQFRRDLHDGVQQTLAAARMDLDGLLDTLPGPAPAVADELAGKLVLALDQIRGLERGTAPPELSAGLDTAVARMATELRLDATRRITDDDLGVLTLPAYYLLREALTNVHKHAGDSHVEVVVEPSDGVVEVVVRDGGAGGATLRPGRGLAGLRDRVTELGGTLTVESPSGTGTTLRALLPSVPT